jgi:hypothetical protein
MLWTSHPPQTCPNWQSVGHRLFRNSQAPNPTVPERPKCHAAIHQVQLSGNYPGIQGEGSCCLGSSYSRCHPRPLGLHHAGRAGAGRQSTKRRKLMHACCDCIRGTSLRGQPACRPSMRWQEEGLRQEQLPRWCRVTGQLALNACEVLRQTANSTADLMCLAQQCGAWAYACVGKGAQHARPRGDTLAPHDNLHNTS